MVAFLLQADELDGEIDLRSCTDVTEYAVQRNYGFQIHVSCVQQGGHAWRAPRGGVGVEHDFPSEIGLCHSLPRDPVLRASQKLCCQHSWGDPGIIGRGGSNVGETWEPVGLFQV